MVCVQLVMHLYTYSLYVQHTVHIDKFVCYVCIYIYLNIHICININECKFVCMRIN